MKLPDNRIGISDILKYRDCPRKMAYQMRRHTEGAQPPEDQHPDTLYGSCFHDMVEAVEKDDLTEDEAVQFAFNEWGHILKPDDIEKIKADLDLYWTRQETGVRTVANETEIAVPLLEWEGEMIYFRARIDRLYQRLDNEGVFIHRDFKSSKWPKSDAEVHSDLQFWAYNWAIHEYWPEVENLIQIYDQLRYGEVPTRKSDAQREQIREWLVRQVTAILEDDSEEPEARFNEWCAWCPIKADCPVIPRLSKWSQEKIKELSPADDEQGDIEVYAEKLKEAQAAKKVLEAYESEVKELLKKLPEERLEQLGYRRSSRSFDSWGAEALERVHEILGEEFYGLAKITKTQLEALLKDDPRLEMVLELAEKQQGAPQLRAIRN